MQKIVVLLLLFLLCNACGSPSGKGESSFRNQITNQSTSDGEQNFPKAVGYVNDFAHVLERTDIDRLEKKISSYDKNTTNQIVIISLDLDTLSPKNFEQYSLDLSNSWGVGTQQKNNGLTIFFSPKLKMIRINTGLGTEKVITDAICEKILNRIIGPEFSKGAYFSGLNKATDEIIRLWK